MKNLHEVLNNFRTTLIFLLLVALVTVIFGTVYGAVHQVYRNNANDPQVEVVKQVSDLIKQDIPLDAILGQSDQIDMSSSLSLFVMIYDKDRKLVGSSANLNGQVPEVPASAFDDANQERGNRFTWQPQDGTRIAAILKQVDDRGYVLAGRSLQEIEYREKDMKMLVLISWIIGVLLSLLLAFALKPRQGLTFIEETNVTVQKGNSDPVVVIAQDSESSK